MFIFTADQELCACELMECIIGYDQSLGRKNLIKFVYCFMVLFLILYIFKYFLLLEPFSHQKSKIMFSF
jgi:hypothetical protein